MLVRVYVTTVTRGDVALRKMPYVLSRAFKVARKTILGHEYAGEVGAVGEGVTRFRVGDRVFGTTTGLERGSYAEYVSVPADGIIDTVPSTVSFEDAAPVPVGGLTALHFRRAHIDDARTLLVYGASGSVGTYAVQLGVHFGADVTGVCGTASVGLVGSLGATTVLDHTRVDIVGAGTYDVIFDAVGKAPAGLKRMVTRNGAFVSVKGTTAVETREHLSLLRELLEAGQIRAVIDQRYPLERVRDAHRYVETGRKTGNVLLTVA